MILKDKVAIITGSKQGIGKGIALEFGKQGAKVVVSDLEIKGCEDVVKEIQDNGGEAIAVKCDVSKAKEVKELFKKTTDAFGKLDILVNNAGIYPLKPFLEMTEKEWDKVLDINLKSIFLCSQEAAKIMQQGGSIVNMSSIASIIGFPQLTHYSASKAGINGATRTMALELAEKKIRVNAIAPGIIETPGTKGMVTKEMLAQVPLARAGNPQDIAYLAVYLASEGSSYVTGQVIVIDGGWTVH